MPLMRKGVDSWPCPVCTARFTIPAAAREHLVLHDDDFDCRPGAPAVPRGVQGILSWMCPHCPCDGSDNLRPPPGALSWLDAADHVAAHMAVSADALL